MSQAKQQVTETHFSRSGGSPPSIQNSQPASAVSLLPATPPLLVDIKVASQMLGTSVWNVRVMCWNPKHRAMLAPVRLGAKYLFSPAKLVAFVEALVAGKVEFPRSPSKIKSKRKVSR
jgi:hypothetical protein